MRKISTALLLVIGMSISATAAEWQTINFPSFDHITGIDMINKDTGYVITASGYCFRTVDQGKTWDKFEVIKNVRLESLSFLDGLNGWVCGHKASIYHTTDGGYSWNNQSLPDTEAVFFDIQMTDYKSGIAVGMRPQGTNRLNSIGVRTADSGQNWEKFDKLGLAYSEARYQPETNKLFFLSLGRLNISTDNGRKWESFNTIEGTPARTFSIFGGSGIMAGLKGACGYSSDTGKTWSQVPQEKTTTFLCSALLDEKRGYLAGVDGFMISTADGGKSWQKEEIPVDLTIMDMCYVDKFLFVIGRDGLIMYREFKDK